MLKQYCIQILAFMVKMVVQLIWLLQTSFFLELLSAEVDFSKGKLRESDLESQTTPQYLQSNRELCRETRRQCGCSSIGSHLLFSGLHFCLALDLLHSIPYVEDLLAQIHCVKPFVWSDCLPHECPLVQGYKDVCL